MKRGMTQWQINIRETKLPLFEALALRVPSTPSSFLRQLCKKQRVAVNGKKTGAEHLVSTGDIITVKTSQRWEECLEQSGLQPAQILYEDDDCMVLDKPAGLAIHRAHGHDDNLLRRALDFSRLRKESFQISPVHRLDIGTSGTVLFGKGRASISQLGQMIMAGQLTKRYLALVEGRLTAPGELNSPVPAKGKVKAALTRFRPLATTGTHTLLELDLITGRQHQIRNQLATAGCPIIGDTRYHGQPINELQRPFLHCYQLSFLRPGTGQIVVISSPLPGELYNLLTALAFPPQTLPPEMMGFNTGQSQQKDG